MSKPILTAVKDFGVITVPFADRCQEYKDAGIPMKPTTNTTIRVMNVAENIPTTYQMCTVERFHLAEMYILN